MNITKKNILDTCQFDTIEIDGIKIGGICYSSEVDKKKAEKILQEVVNSSDKTGYDLAMYVMKTLQERCEKKEEKEEEKTN